MLFRSYTKAEDRFLSSLKKIDSGQVSDSKTISFKYNYQNTQLPLQSILYIEAFDNYIKIVTPEKTYMPVMTMKKIQSLLPDDEFIRIHKSYIIAVSKIKSFNSEQAITIQKKIPIGRSYRKVFLNQMQSLKQPE